MEEISFYTHINNLKEEEWQFFKLDRNLNHIESIFEVGFIKDYFEQAKKNDVLNDFKLDYGNIERIEHSISLYFLGCLFYKNFNFKEKINVYREDAPTKKDEFFLVWFLVSLSHDFGYFYENQDFSEELKSLDCVFSYFKIKSKLEINKNASDKSKILYENIENYYNYRINEGSKKPDHGIIAGIVLYNFLIENRLKKSKSKIYWQKSLEEFYKASSISIAIHNIWAPSFETVDLYKKYNLNDLLSDKTFPISINDYPLLFLLGIVDTIEPIKRFYADTHKKYSVHEILNRINFMFMRNKLSISISGSILKDKEVIKIYFNSIKGLGVWLKVKVEEVTINKKIEIEFLN